MPFAPIASSRLSALTACCAALLIAAASHAVPPTFIPPDDSGVVNVKTDFGAKGDGKTDDTEAIQKAISSVLDEGRYATPAMVYLPAGTYLVSGPLEGKLSQYGWSGGWRAGMLLVGESPEKTTIRLKDKAEGYGDEAKPKWVLATGSESDKRTKAGDKPLSGGGNRAFRHNIMNLTVDVGRGNPGAIALDYVVSNRGTVRNVHLVAPKGSGHTGLNMTRNWPGPGYIVDVKITGFDYGMRVSHSQYGMTFERITLKDQRKAGITNTHNMLAMRGLISDNRVPAFDTSGERGLIVLLDSELKGGSKNAAAFTGKNRLMLRNVDIAGYGLAIDDTHGKTKVPAEGLIESYASKINNLTPDRIDQDWRLEVKDAPQFQPTSADQWVSVTSFGATPGGDDDDSDGIQKAIDSGSPVVYIPRGSYRITKPLIVRGKTRLIIGFQSALNMPKDMRSETPILRYEGVEGESTILEHIWLAGRIEHAGAGTLTLRHVDIANGYRNTEAGSGDVFTEDTIGKPWHFNHPQNAWLRQINCEFGQDPLIENHGATLWFLGYKTEGEMVCFRQTAGETDMNGTLFYPLGNRNPTGPAVLIEQGRFAGSLRMNSRGYQLFAGAAMGDAEQSVRWKDVGSHAAPLILLDVPEAGLGQPLEAGAVPAWNGAAGNPHTDEHGYTWLAVAAGSTNVWDQPKHYVPLDKWNAGSGRFEDTRSMQDSAPSYAPGPRVLRTRSGGGHLAGLVIRPPSAGNYSLQGSAALRAWGPKEPLQILVVRVAADQSGTVLLDTTAKDGTAFDWSSENALQNISLKKGESIAIIGANVGGGTGSIDFDDVKNAPTRLVPSGN